MVGYGCRMTSPYPPLALDSNGTRDEVQLRDNVLAIVAHDLRTPLSAISMAVELLMDGASVAARATYLSMIKEATQQAEHLIRDLVDVAQIEKGKLSIDCHP
jgi:signal transduction histidine kinase